MEVPEDDKGAGEGGHGHESAIDRVRARIQAALGEETEDWLEKAIYAITSWRNIKNKKKIYYIDTIGGRIGAARTLAGMTKTELARRLDVHWTLVGQWESGKTPVEMRRLMAISVILCVSPDWLLMNSDEGGPVARNVVLRKAKNPKYEKLDAYRKKQKKLCAQAKEMNKERRERAKRHGHGEPRADETMGGKAEK